MQEDVVATNPPSTDSDRGAFPEGQPPPIPDEDGPHDVPDEKVIEKTVPSVPIPEDGKNSLT